MWSLMKVNVRLLAFAWAGSTVAISASWMSVGIKNFLKIVDQFTKKSEKEIVDNWGQVINRGQNFLEVHRLFKSSETITVSRYIVDRRSLSLY